jgi:hypothetical protein
LPACRPPDVFHYDEPEILPSSTRPI